MKQSIKRALACMAIVPVIAIAESKAADITLDGSGYYKLSESMRYYHEGASQYGRRYNLGGGYYHKATCGMDWVTNRSNRNSGPLSIEFWGMPYYGATKGMVLMTRSANPLRGGAYYHDKSWSGWKLFLDERRFPELNVWESTRKGWRFRDALSFRRSNIL